MDYCRNDKEQYEYSKKKLPELHERYNEFEDYVRKKREEMNGKIDRHQRIIDEFEKKDIIRIEL